MAIDIRARVTCTLGEVIGASISDSYIQGAGLIQTSGSCQIKGIVTPSMGDRVVFQYTKSGITRRIPRTMRVLSSFADPLRRVTDVELGCKLTYLQNLKDPIKLPPSEDPENSELTDEDAEIITRPTRANFVMKKCLEAMGISADSYPLTNKFSIAEFDISGGYISVLSDLLISESYCGYLDENEILKIINIAASGGSGPLISSQDLIDIGPIGVGELPGDAVFVSYSSLKLRSPDDEPIAEREEEEEQEDLDTEESTRSTINIAYAATIGGEALTQNKEFEDLQTISTETRYQDRTFVMADGRGFERKRVVEERKVKEGRSLAAIAGGLVTQYLEGGVPFGNFPVYSEAIETFTYDFYGNEIRREFTKTGPRVFGTGMVGLQFVFETSTGTQSYTPPTTEMILEEVIVETETRGDFKKVTTSRYGPWVATIPGQQSVAEARDALDDVSKVASYLDVALGGRFLIDYSVTTVKSRGGEQSLPLREDGINEGLAEETGDPDNGFRTESVSETEVVTGSLSAQRRIELSMPYAPDDTFRKDIASSNPTVYEYYSVASDAPAKAAKFGRTQNRMLLGNRSGMSIQTVPEKLPNAPFAPVFIEAAGTINLYRVNAASWTMDSSGIVASTDAMFWGTAGRTA